MWTFYSLIYFKCEHYRGNLFSISAQAVEKQAFLHYNATSRPSKDEQHGPQSPTDWSGLRVDRVRVQSHRAKRKVQRRLHQCAPCWDKNVPFQHFWSWIIFLFVGTRGAERPQWRRSCIMGRWLNKKKVQRAPPSGSPHFFLTVKAKHI